MFARIPLTPLRVSRPTSALSSFRRPASRDSLADARDVVVLTDDGSTVVCWHPERPFPYELSRPLPQEAARGVACPAEALGVQAVREVRELYRARAPETTRDQLMKITHTTKHIWFPKGRAQYRKKIEPDREYL
ncbi:large ribosomal subunit protein mL42 [Bacillus rossius redtenbacheri]|uniref:large ribosomal subunit protein mL42 n=1 Tax=Bacillus rossius redtenbacheri TaxID=93214 RepID=UPI002FDF00FB